MDECLAKYVSNDGTVKYVLAKFGSRIILYVGSEISFGGHVKCNHEQLPDNTIVLTVISMEKGRPVIYLYPWDRQFMVIYDIKPNDNQT